MQGIHAGRLRCRGSCEGHLRWEFGGGHGGAPILTTVEEVIVGAAEDLAAVSEAAKGLEAMADGRCRAGGAAS